MKTILEFEATPHPNPNLPGIYELHNPTLGVTFQAELVCLPNTVSLVHLGRMVRQAGNEGKVTVEAVAKMIEGLNRPQCKHEWQNTPDGRWCNLCDAFEPFVDNEDNEPLEMY